MNERGISLIEVLVVIAIFAILGILVTRSVILTLQGSQKSESQVKVRENMDYSLSVIERQIRNADSVAPCPNSDKTIINYIDQNGVSSSFSCEFGMLDSFIASGSARLTSTDVSLYACSFSCSTSGEGNPSLVTIDLTIKDKSSGSQKTSISSSTQIYLRNY